MSREAAAKAQQTIPQVHVKKALSAESLIFIIIFGAVFGLLGVKMGAVNMINTMLNTA